MNEEEIINILTDDIVALNVGYEKYEEAVQGLLNLYNKEKERNKDLEQIEKEHKEENGRLREENKQLYRQLQDIHENFCKFDWQNSNPKQLHNQLAELYESIYRK